MKQKYCIYLNNGINFHYSGLTFCNKLWMDYTFYKYDKDFLEAFFERKRKILDNMKKGIAPEHCSNCIYLQELDENAIIDEKIKRAEIYHWNQCNCACFYCSNRHTTKLKISKGRNHKGVINIVDNLKKLKKLNLLDENTEFSMVGGEPTILKEFPDLLKFIIKHKYRVDMLSNGILYEKYIPKAILANNESTVCISLDCASRETFKRIKGVDKFDDVIKNIKRYVKEAKEYYYRVMVKYIILKGVNDTKKEIDDWIDLCVSLGVTNLFVSIEFCHSTKDPENSELTDEICELYNYAKEQIKKHEKNLNVATYDFVEEIIKNRSYKIN